MTSPENLRQMTLEEIEAQANEDAPTGWRVTVRLLPDGHTQVRSVKTP